MVQDIEIKEEKTNGLRRRDLLIASAASSLALSGGIAAADDFPNIRIHDHGPFTRLVVELPQVSTISAFQLADPYRLVVDLGDVTWSGGIPDAITSTKLVAAVRAGQFNPSISRIVADLTGPVSPARAFVLAPTGATPWRLVFDLAPSTADAVAAAIGPANPIVISGGLEPGLNRGPVTASSSAGQQKPAAPAETAPPADSKIVIAIDPGHGGIDPGAIGLSGVYEKNLTLAAAQQLKAKLEATGRYRGVLTRSRDTSLGLRQRIDIARHARADAFISLHADSMRDRGTRGLSVYTLSEKASDKEAASLAEAENKADLIIGMDLTNESQEVRNILIDLAQRESMNLASKMAEIMIAELGREVKLLRNTHRFAGFAVLKSPDVPSVLVEMGYLSNREEEAALKREAYRGKLMASVVKAIDRYFAKVQVAKRT
ncbi:MAG: N-acetylmuramoyl-L-alanine amidase [Rhodobacteraceae bacterium]|nr:N-acetylmuramoyl-L-alanine amidase [Paracoccaceae bacterium]